jgi:hypothetical protein
MIDDIQLSLKKAKGYWHGSMDEWRERLTKALETDQSVAPTWFVEGCNPTEDEQYPSMAARARALRFSSSVSDDRLAEIVVHLDEFHKWIPVKFLGYDEAMYSYLKAGETSHNAAGKPRKKKRDGTYAEEAAKASDWYAILDAQVLGCEP